MSNTETPAREVVSGPASGRLDAVHELLEPREVYLSPRNQVRRLLPHRDRRMVGAWCFVDHYGGAGSTEGPMRVPPHPHTGLQTVSWLLAGEIHHRDSQGHDAMVRPGELNLMTAGPGIAHSEYSVDGAASPHGLQLWVALPGHARNRTAPAFAQYTELPQVRRDGYQATVVCGELEGARSPAETFTPLLGAELRIEPGRRVELTLDPAFEHAVHVLSDSVDVDGVRVGFGQLLYLGGGRSTLHLTAPADRPGRALLIGGAPFDEEIVMWWNFIGRTHEEIVEMREAWNRSDGGRFGVVPDDGGGRLLAPLLPSTRLRGRGRLRDR
jgi:quercetin 2,3-dioxygenase